MHPTALPTHRTQSLGIPGRDPSERVVAITAEQVVTIVGMRTLDWLKPCRVNASGPMRAQTLKPARSFAWGGLRSWNFRPIGLARKASRFHKPTYKFPAKRSGRQNDDNIIVWRAQNLDQLAVHLEPKLPKTVLCLPKAFSAVLLVVISLPTSERFLQALTVSRLLVSIIKTLSLEDAPRLPATTWRASKTRRQWFALRRCCVDAPCQLSQGVDEV